MQHKCLYSLGPDKERSISNKEQHHLQLKTLKGFHKNRMFLFINIPHITRNIYYLYIIRMMTWMGNLSAMNSSIIVISGKIYRQARQGIRYRYPSSELSYERSF